MNRTSDLRALNFCVIDTETTGGNPELNRIIDVAVVRYQDGIIMERYHTLINPGRPIPFWITMLTGISDDMVKDAPKFEEIAEDLKAILSKGVFTAHNARFDYGFVLHEYKRMGMEFEQPLVCTLKMARFLFPDIPSRSLGSLCEHLLIEIYDRHRALGDAEATVYVLKHMLQKAKSELGISNWDDLDAFQRAGVLHLPNGLTYSDVSRLPMSEGSYKFRNEAGEVVFLGRAKNIQRRVLTYFSRNNQSKKSNRFREVVRSIEVV